MNRLQEKFWLWLAWHLPRTLVYWATIRACSHATTGKWGNELAPAVTAEKILQRWWQ